MDERNYDVVICGGGTAGAIAGIASARNGAKTLIIEKEQWLGGGGAVGFFPHSFFANGSGKRGVLGIPEEIIQRLIKMGGSLGHLRFENGHLWAHTPVDHEIKRVLLMEMVSEAGCDLLLDSIINDVTVIGDRIISVTAQNKAGTEKISGKIFLDCTGDGDIGFRAGAPFEKGRKDGLMQPASLNMRLTNVDMVKFANSVPTDKAVLWVDRPSGNRSPVYFVGRLGQWDDTPEAKELFTDRNHQLFCLCVHENDIIANMSRIIGVDGTKEEDAIKAAVSLRVQTYKMWRFLRKYVPGFENCNLICETVVGFRETRRFIGQYTITKEDILAGRMFDDNVGLACYPMDMHDPNGGNVTFTQIGGDGRWGIPYRALIPQKIHNLLVAGRCLSCTHEALASARSIASCEVQGQAAGTAASLCIKKHMDPSQLNVYELKQLLRDQKVILD